MEMDSNRINRKLKAPGSISGSRSRRVFLQLPPSTATRPKIFHSVGKNFLPKKLQNFTAQVLKVGLVGGVNNFSVEQFREDAYRGLLRDSVFQQGDHEIRPLK